MPRSHLSVLASSAIHYADLPAFRTPVVDQQSNSIVEWRSITYREFSQDVDRFARYWRRHLRTAGIPHRSVVGMWLSGGAYLDVLHVYGLARAGYIPQLFSLRLPNPEVVYNLMADVHAAALIHDMATPCSLSGSPVPTFAAVPSCDVLDNDEPLPSLGEDLGEDDIFCIFHTSGSTSGLPKVIRCSYRWLDHIITKADVLCRRRNTARQDVTTWVGSMSHIAQTFMLIGALSNGACTIQPTKPAFSSDEMVDMVRRCSLNCIRQFGTFLSIHIRAARSDPGVLAALQSMDEVFFCGIGLLAEDEAFAYKHNIKLRNVFGSTEVGALLYTADGERFLQQLPGTKYAFLPMKGSEAAAATRNPNARLVELVVLGESPDCPHKSMCGSDGNYHTGDLFQEVKPGRYLFRGRDDDWIKSENSLRCDTKSIEDNVRATCGDLIEDCVVVGNGRPSPTLFIEPSAACDEQQLKQQILERTRHFHSRRYMHERIVESRFIIVVPPKTLPRTSTKGNIRRKAIEEDTTFRTLLDGVYASH